MYSAVGGAAVALLDAATFLRPGGRPRDARGEPAPPPAGAPAGRGRRRRHLRPPPPPPDGAWRRAAGLLGFSETVCCTRSRGPACTAASHVRRRAASGFRGSAPSPAPPPPPPSFGRAGERYGRRGPAWTLVAAGCAADHGGELRRPARRSCCSAPAPRGSSSRDHTASAPDTGAPPGPHVLRRRGARGRPADISIAPAPRSSRRSATAGCSGRRPP